jgi:hypothetical protein
VGGETFREGDVLLSDAPWAIAWYADRSAIWLPFDFEPAPGEGHFAEKDYLAINDGVRLIAGIYLTQALLQQTPRDMMMGYERYWLAMYMGNPPGNTPLQLKQVAATGRGLQVLISNRPR